MGISLDLAAREYVAARKLLGEVSVVEAAKFYDRHGKSITKAGTLSDILKAMLKSLKDDKRSQYHIRDIRRHVGRFVKKFKCGIDEIDTSKINKWLRSLKVGGRTRDNHRDSVHNFFHFARSEGYLPEDRPTAADKTKRVNDAGAENAVFEVEEMQKMLTGAPDWIIPSLAIKAFSGIRTEEMLRLKWEDIKFDQDVIFLGKKVTKTKQRRIVPLLPNLKLWLTRHRQDSGLISARWGSGHTLSKAWSNRAKEVGVVYKKNGMRNSYISYRVAVVKNVAQIALESGNSPRVIQSEYLELVTEDAGKKWFEIVPEEKLPSAKKRKDKVRESS